MVSRLVALALAGWLAGCVGSSSTTPTRKLPAIAELTPPGLDGVYLGMTVDELRATRPKVQSYKNPEVRFRNDLFEKPGGSMELVIYFLTRAEPAILYQIIVQYADPSTPDDMLANRYLPRGTTDDTHVDEVEIRGYAYPVRVWTYQKRLLIAATIETPED